MSLETHVERSQQFLESSLGKPLQDIREQSIVRDLQSRSFGILVPVSALRGQGALGIGDTGCVKDAIDFCSRWNIKILQVLPINETGGDNSPYLPISNLALDPMLLEISPKTVPGLTQEELDSLVDDQSRESLNVGGIKYEEVKLIKARVLRAAFENFVVNEISNESPIAQEFATFQEKYKIDLEAYTLYRYLIAHYKGNSDWMSWSDEHKDIDAARTWAAQSEYAPQIATERNFYAYAQWVARRQWQEVRHHADLQGVELLGDIPFGVSRNSADVWANKELFDLQWSVGAPPEGMFRGDPFTERWGQNWGSPLYNWQAHIDTDYAWWRRRVEHTTDIFSSFRFDHALGPFRAYAFPWKAERNQEFTYLSPSEAAERCNGEVPRFFPGPDYPEQSAQVNADQGHDFFEMLKTIAKNSGIIAEDLGATVPGYVHSVLDELTIPGYFIPQFHRDIYGEYFSSERAPQNVVATFGTHDHEPLAVSYRNWVQQWHGHNGHEAYLDLQRLMRWIGHDQHSPPLEFSVTLHKELLASILSLSSRIVILNLPDLTRSEERWNSPAMEGLGNWTTRMTRTFAELEQDPEMVRTLEFVSSIIIQSQRIQIDK
jgi:4-alpha-glucanotransferase